MSVTVLNTTASLSGKTLLKAEDSQTITGQKTFDLGASSPFLVVSGAAKVANLDADLLDGQEGTYYTNASNLASGTVPTARLGSGTANIGTALRGDSTWGVVTPLSAVCGRLTLTTATPVTVTDVTAAGTLYYALYVGNRIALYNATTWVLMEIAQLSISVPAAANQMYDAFVDYNSGTPALTLTAWTNDTNRATALTTQNGVLVLTGSTGKRYVGSVRTVTASQLNDTERLRHVYNYYNAVPSVIRRFESGSWTYTTATIRQANNSTTNQVEVVQGVAERALALDLKAVFSNTSAGVGASVGIGQNTTSAYTSTGLLSGMASINVGYNTPVSASINVVPAVGYSYFSWNEYSSASGTATWYGASANFIQSGLMGTWWR
jgi:hypothetical protein